MPQPIPYVIDFDGLTMDTTQANDKLVPPAMLEVKNIEVSRRGRARKTYGYDHISTNTVSPNVPGVGGTVNAIAPTVLGSLGSTTNCFQVCNSGGEFFYQVFQASGWVAATAVGPGDTVPWSISWGINNAGSPVVYFAGAGGVFAVEGLTGGAVKYGASGSAPWTIAKSVEFFRDKLFVGNATVGGSVKSDRIYWSETGDDNGWSAGGGSGFLDLRDPGGGTAAISFGITGMRVYKNRLYIAGGNNLYVLTGTTSATFGVDRVVDVDVVTGSTMYVSGEILWYVDQLGIWGFNGRESKNVMSPAMHDKWEALSPSADVELATASWDDIEGIYRVYFPSAQQQWNYHYRTNQWDIRTFSGPDIIRVIGPPINALEGRATNYTLGGLTNGRAFNVNDQVALDNGATITGSVTTGNIRLGEINGRVGDHARLLYMDIETVQQDEAGVVKVDITIDGVIQYEFKSPGGTGLVAQAIDGSEIVISVDGSHGLTAPFVMKVDSEQMHCTSVTGNDFTVTRGYNRTTAVTHGDNTAYTYDVETGSLTIGDAGSSAYTSPTHYDGKPTSRIDLGNITKSGRFFQFRFWDDDANSRMDLRRVTIWYERLENAGSRPS